ncbi:hypothetical protein LCGC14_2613260 [marine sediment metagenome]|uniref:Uncharacterized protein n=1 Tax=marine sediment metagenome TaxID=412755 RepID=A0A0F9CY09_9ZZZZ
MLKKLIRKLIKFEASECSNRGKLLAVATCINCGQGMCRWCAPMDGSKYCPNCKVWWKRWLLKLSTKDLLAELHDLLIERAAAEED